MDTGLSNKLLILGLILIYIGYLDNRMNARPELYTYEGNTGVYIVYEDLGQIKTPNGDIVEYTRAPSVNHIFFTLYFNDGRSYGMNTKNPDQISAMLTVYAAMEEDLDLWLSLISGEPDFEYIDNSLVNVNPTTPGLIYTQLPALLFGIAFIFAPYETLGEFLALIFRNSDQFFQSPQFGGPAVLLGVYLLATASFRLMAG